MSGIKKITAALLVCLVLAGLAGCSEKDEYSSRVIAAMDTVIEFYISADKDVSELLGECEKIVYEVESAVSVTRSDSEISKLNETGSAEVGGHVLALLEAAKKVYEATGGAFDPTVYPAVELWKPLWSSDGEGVRQLPDAEELAGKAALVGFDKVSIDGNTVTLSHGAKLDLGGIAKGYTAGLILDRIGTRAEDYGVRGAIISFGGAVSVYGEKSNGQLYRIGLRSPDGEGSFGYVNIAGGKGNHVSVSGDYERYAVIDGKRYHHVIDPATLYPADNGVRSVSVISEDGTISDALSTAFFILGYEKTEEIMKKGVFDCSAVFYLTDGSVRTFGNVDFTGK